MNSLCVCVLLWLTVKLPGSTRERPMFGAPKTQSQPDEIKNVV